MHLIPYNLLYDEYFTLSNVIINVIEAKLGKVASRENNIYFARFIMMCINHLVKKVELDSATDQLPCWTQSTRVFMVLVRINRHSGIGLTYPPFVQVFLSTLSSFQTQYLSFAVVEGENQQLPTRAAKPSKLKSKKTTSSVSQRLML